MLRAIIHCPHCDARYTESDDWRAMKHNPKTGISQVSDKIPRDHCPICQAPATSHQERK